ncbi:hypothetical protein JCM17846_33280 [Iodidimonas nitroreducens]|uniref:Uncharacterized protein n=1 Tax=Iodidimonas nitroreducens TaxID=1236968 RepID=A0A5A7NF93_9PROT|nr:hypothetical protein AQ1_02237 [alpha proteobacterium Q-1]GER05646.1 hypothetical protein JCM17846_33280 [Iodidimonas nitroreducens]
MSDEEIEEKKDPDLRLPRQAQHYAQLVAHFVAVKNSNQVAGAMDAHFERLDLSRICAAPSARLSHFPFKSDRTFPAQC